MSVSSVIVWLLIALAFISTVVFGFYSIYPENFSSPVYDQWHPTNYFQGGETLNNRERYFDWLPYPRLNTVVQVGSWDKN